MRLSKIAAAVFLLLAFRLCGGEPARTLPPGAFLHLGTSALASFDRGLFLMSQAVMPPGAAGGGLDLDGILRQYQSNAFLPSLASSYLQTFTGLAGAKFDPDAGIALAVFPGDKSGKGSLGALWLPVSNFDAMASGAAAGRPEYRNIRTVKDREGALEVSGTVFSRSAMYFSKAPRGAVYSNSLAGLDKGLGLWGKSPPATLSDAGGFNAFLHADFTVPGALEAVTAGLRGPVEDLVGELSRGDGGDLLTNATMNILRLVSQAREFRGEIRMNRGGEIGLDAEAIPLAGSDLERFVAIPENRDLDQIYAAAMPDDATVIAACAGGEQARSVFAAVLSQLVLVAMGTRDDPPLQDLMRMAGFMLSSSRGNTALALTSRADMALLLTAADADAAGAVARDFNSGMERFAAGSEGARAAVGYGTDPGRIAEGVLRAAAGGPERKGMRPEIAGLYRRMGGNGVFMLLAYPADIIKILLTANLRRQYESRDSTGESEMELFSAALYGKLIDASDSAPLAREALSLALFAAEGRIAASGRARVAILAESMDVYRRMIFSLMPAPTRR